MVRRGILLALALLLSACGGSEERAPFTDSRLPPDLSQSDWAPHNWAWGLVRVGGAPTQRYGVGAPRSVPRAQILILPGYGDFAENHFAEARALIGLGYTVWILDGAGQGGSARSASPRDLGHLTSFAGDAQALQAMVTQVIRPGADAPLVIVAVGTAAPLAMRAVQSRQVSAIGLIVVAPVLKAPQSAELEKVAWAPQIGLGFLRVPGGQGWRRDDRPTAPGERRHQAWQIANPDLRMGDPSLGWVAAFDALTKEVVAHGWTRIGTPILLRPANAAASADEIGLCHALPHCTVQALSAGDAASAVAFIRAVMPPSSLAPMTGEPPPSDDLTPSLAPG